LKLLEIQGMRGLAIAIVAIFHFTIMWDGVMTKGHSFYPFADFAEPVHTVLRQGRLGVELFFIISGFVVALTLEKCFSTREFFVKRFSRLWPPLLVCLPIVWGVLQVAAPLPLASKSPLALLESFTLVDPAVLGPLNTGNVSGVLWSLWIEIQFYAVSGFLYFRTKNFLRTLVVLGFVYSALYVMGAVYSMPPQISALLSLRNYFWWFIAGVCVHKIRQTGASKSLWVIYAASFLMSSLSLGEITYGWRSVFAYLFNASIFMLFFGFAKRRPLTLLKIKPLVALGNSSYEFYLIHEVLGVSVLHAFKDHTALSGTWLIIPIFATIWIISFAVNRYWSGASCIKTRQKLLNSLIRA